MTLHPGSGRIDSDSTLYGNGDTVPDPQKDGANGSLNKPRPTVATAKFQTEGPESARFRYPDLNVRRRATEDGSPQSVAFSPKWPHAHDWDLWDSSSSSSDNEDEEEVPSRSRTSGGGITSKRNLNRTYTGLRRARENRRFESFSVGNGQVESHGKVSKTDGRLKISVNEATNSGYIAKALGAHIHHHLTAPSRRIAGLHSRHDEPDINDESQALQIAPPPKLNIVIMVIGSRGDVQPFLKIGAILKEKHGHRVRIATHPAFKEFVENGSGLEFFSVGGDPSELMAFMVKNPGLLPSLETVMAGEIGRRRQAMYEMFQGFWRACINATDDEKDLHNVKMMGDKFPFVADAIIANPPSMAHLHCAEALNIPLHLMFTFPYTPTQAFPHPLANIKRSNVDTNYTNYMSYPLVDLMTWQGLGDLVNKFRTRTLGLEPISTLWAPGQFARLKVDFTYLWSPSLVPKPEDWGPEIEIAGYVFFEGASSYQPPDSLARFLDAGEAIYIGFGSISGIKDPKAFTQMIFDAVEKAGVRAVVSKGWGGIGEMEIPSNICIIDSVPHDWLFPRVAAVIHHGGAGTTAIGLKCAKPTLIVPFFGDQPFWAAMIARAGAGADSPIPYKQLTADKLAEGIKQCLSKNSQQKAQELADYIDKEGDGADNAVHAFHRGLPLGGHNSMRCSVFPDRVAVWLVKRTSIQLSPLAADLLTDTGRLRWSDLRLARIREWHDFQGPGEPITGAGGAMVASVGHIIGSLSSIPGRARKNIQRYETQKRHAKGKTVANGAVLPGEIAERIMKERAPQVEQQSSITDNVKEVNLQGKAAPSRDSKLLTAIPTPSVAQNPLGSLSSNQEMESRKEDLARSRGHNQNSKPPVVEVAHTTAKGFGYSLKALIKMPLDCYYAITLGFHNAPRLYGDQTVRPTPHIYGMRSGVVAARDEVVHGFIDGVTGVVKLPYQGLRDDGFIGYITGTGKGLGGLVLKPTAGVLGVGAYFGKGCRAEIRKLAKDTSRTDRWIRRARIIQGQKDVHELRSRNSCETPENKQLNELDRARTAVMTRWQEVVRREEHKAAAEHRHSRLPKVASFSAPRDEKMKNKG